jgi:hypothetical protein
MLPEILSKLPTFSGEGFITIYYPHFIQNFLETELAGHAKEVKKAIAHHIC